MAKKNKKPVNLADLKEDAQSLFTAFFFCLDKEKRPTPAEINGLIDKELLQILADFLEYRQRAEKTRAKAERERLKIQAELLRLKQQYLPTFKEYIDK